MAFSPNNLAIQYDWHCRCIGPGSANTGFAPSNEVSDSMPKRRQPKEPQEPMGIIISGGTHEEPTPKLSAYVYSIEDETSGEPIDVRAA